MKTSPRRLSPDLETRPGKALEERLAGVFSLREATPALKECLESIHIDEDSPAFFLDWNVNNVQAFVDAAKQGAGQGFAMPAWLTVEPLQMTQASFVNDVMNAIEVAAGPRCGVFMLAPNDKVQFVRILGNVLAIQNDDYLQAVAQTVGLHDAAFGGEYLGQAYFMTDNRAQNFLVPNRANFQPLPRLFN